MEVIINKSIIEVLQGDITKLKVDCIVNAANTSLLGGGGVDGAIHRAGGREILEACMKIRERQGGCSVGEAVITPAGKLEAKYVIHTVGPVWNNGKSNEEEKLRDCYFNTLELAKQYNVISIAFPNISTGIYRFPKVNAARIAIDEVISFIKEQELMITVKFICFDDENYEIYKEMLMSHVS
jgi:O-acetyl-ADP-ribose deacetylase (regulator of RNase III)